MSVGPGHFAVLSAVVFGIGLFGALTRSDVAGVLIAVAVLFAAPVIALVGFAHIGLGGQLPPTGDALAFLTLLAVGAETLLAGGIAVLLWRRSGGAVPEDADVEI